MKKIICKLLGHKLDNRRILSQEWVKGFPWEYYFICESCGEERAIGDNMTPFR